MTSCRVSCTTPCMTTSYGIVQGVLHYFVLDSEIIQVHVQGNSANPAGSCRISMILLPILQDFFTRAPLRGNTWSSSISRKPTARNSQKLRNKRIKFIKNAPCKKTRQFIARISTRKSVALEWQIKMDEQ